MQQMKYYSRLTLSRCWQQRINNRAMNPFNAALQLTEGARDFALVGILSTPHTTQKHTSRHYENISAREEAGPKAALSHCTHTTLKFSAPSTGKILMKGRINSTRHSVRRIVSYCTLQAPIPPRGVCPTSYRDTAGMSAYLCFEEFHDHGKSCRQHQHECCDSRPVHRVRVELLRCSLVHQARDVRQAVDDGADHGDRPKD